MSQQVARTPGAKRAGDGEYVFDLNGVNHILGGPDYSTANGACVEGERMIVALMRMPAGTSGPILTFASGFGTLLRECQNQRTTANIKS